MSITAITEKYMQHIQQDPYHRYSSWDHYHGAFNGTNPTNLSIELGFYLASWGMYRGSSGLLQRNHQVHDGAITILSSVEYVSIRCTAENEVTKHSIAKIVALKNQLAKHYQSIAFFTSSTRSKFIAPTETLISKIILGSYGCVPAYDRYFLDGLKSSNQSFKQFNATSLEKLFDFIDANKPELWSIQQTIASRTSHHYPLMKIIDMYFWQLGYDRDVMLKHGKKEYTINI